MKRNLQWMSDDIAAHEEGLKQQASIRAARVEISELNRRCIEVSAELREAAAAGTTTDTTERLEERSQEAVIAR